MNDINENLLTYKNHLMNVSEINKLQQKIDSSINDRFELIDRSVFFSSDQLKMSSKEFRKLYDSKRVGLSHKIAYFYMTGKSYNPRILAALSTFILPFSLTLKILSKIFDFLFIVHWQWTFGVIITILCAIATIIYT